MIKLSRAGSLIGPSLMPGSLEPTNVSQVPLLATSQTAPMAARLLWLLYNHTENTSPSAEGHYNHSWRHASIMTTMESLHQPRKAALLARQASVNSSWPCLLCSHFCPGKRESTSPGGSSEGLWLVQTQSFIWMRNCAVIGANMVLHLHEGLPWMLQTPLPHTSSGYLGRLIWLPFFWVN
jgi:hypothetical protein